MTRSGLEPKASRIASTDGHRRSSGPVQESGRDPQADLRGTVSTPPLPVGQASSRFGYTHDGQRTAESIKAAHQAWSDAQMITTACAFCGWTHDGTVLEGRERALAHRQTQHPEACIRRARPKGSRITKRKLRSAGEEEQVKLDAAEANRIRAEREQGEMLAKIERGRERNRLAEAALDGAAV